MTTPRRLLRELASPPTSACITSLSPVSDQNLQHLRATLHGPANSPYHGGVWTVDVRVPNEYPQQPPKVSFVNRMCHPNVHPQTGEICLDLLRNAWSPAYTIHTTLAAVVQLLTDPEPDSPLNVDAALLLRRGDKVAYESLVRVWKVLYATKE